MTAAGPTGPTTYATIRDRSAGAGASMGMTSDSAGNTERIDNVEVSRTSRASAR
jgi:hypothetical protein